MQLDPSLLRSIYIGKTIKGIIDNNPDITISSIAEKAKISRWPFNNALNWKSAWSDNMFRLAMEAIPLTETEIQKIFMEADKEEFKYKHWTWLETLILEDLKWKPETTVKELEESLFQLSGVDNPTEEDKLTLRFALDMARKRAEEDKQKKNKK